MARGLMLQLGLAVSLLQVWIALIQATIATHPPQTTRVEVKGLKDPEYDPNTEIGSHPFTDIGPESA